MCHQCQSKQVSVLNKTLLCSPHLLLPSGASGWAVASFWAAWPLTLPFLARLQGQTAWEASSLRPTDSRGWKRKFDRAYAVNSKIAIGQQDMVRVTWSWQFRKNKKSWHPGSVVMEWMVTVRHCCTQVFLQSQGSRTSQGRSKQLLSFGPNRPPTIWLQISMWSSMQKVLCFLPWCTDKSKGR